ncbi:uncharacterized protein LOC120684448 [Panicum virgatum]|uniref:uncharacterized protein LOC120684448 n=1 Tax=Panicum virgatum TaxID=38727 RepID=UPI0019D6A3CF|nr:uncharacterized protein LOC120684448 [Panicum virgatum]
MTSTKKPARKTPGSSSQTLAITSALDADAPTNASSSSSEDTTVDPSTEADEEDIPEIISQTSPKVQIQCLPSKRARITSSSVQGTTIGMQESPIIPQDIPVDTGIPTLSLRSSSAPNADETRLK